MVSQPLQASDLDHGDDLQKSWNALPQCWPPTWPVCGEAEGGDPGGIWRSCLLSGCPLQNHHTDTGRASCNGAWPHTDLSICLAADSNQSSNPMQIWLVANPSVDPYMEENSRKLAPTKPTEYKAFTVHPLSTCYPIYIPLLIILKCPPKFTNRMIHLT